MLLISMFLHVFFHRS